VKLIDETAQRLIKPSEIYGTRARCSPFRLTGKSVGLSRGLSAERTRDQNRRSRR